jgi:prolyl oligopeptidase PreP (S9A serine peptidase family)
VQHDQVKWVKYSGASWTKDGKGFFYSRYDEPKAEAQFQSLTFNQKIYYHRVGTSQADDALIYRRPEHPGWVFHAQATDNGRYLILTTHVGTAHKYRITYKDLKEPDAEPVDLIDNFDHEYSFVDNDGPVLFFKTDLDAPRGRLIAIDTRIRNEPTGRRSFRRRQTSWQASTSSAIYSWPTTSRMPRRKSRCTRWPEILSAKSSSPVLAQPQASVANAQIRKRFIPFPASLRRRRSTATI